MDKEKEKLVLNHIYLADKIAVQMFSKLKNKYSLDELKSSAYLGLIDAAEKYEVDNNKPFENFAGKRQRSFHSSLFEYFGSFGGK